MSPRGILKGAVRAFFLVLVLPCAILSGFGHFSPGFTFWAQAIALIPGLPGDYARTAFYRLTLEACSMDSRICFGTFFSSREARVGEAVYIGSYCILGHVNIGARTQIASAVHILSGRHHHPRDAEGRILGSEHGSAVSIDIGGDCWLGEGAIVMADVGVGSTIGAGAVVTREIPPQVVAVGNPAKVIKSAVASREA